MKTQTTNTIARKLLIAATCIAALLFSAQSKANIATKAIIDNETNTTDSTKASKLSVSYNGNTDNGLEFNVRYANVKGEAFTFTIKDETGETLYEKTYTAKQFSKKVQVPEVNENKSFVFSISTASSKTVQTKEVKITPRYVEDVLVKIN